MFAAIFNMSGLGKLAAPAATVGYIGSAGLPVPLVGYVVALVIELGGSLALLIGYRTRVAAAVLAGFAVVTAITFHHRFADQNQLIDF